MMKKMSILFILTLFLGALVGCGNDEVSLQQTVMEIPLWLMTVSLYNMVLLVILLSCKLMKMKLFWDRLESRVLKIMELRIAKLWLR